MKLKKRDRDIAQIKKNQKTRSKDSENDQKIESTTDCRDKIRRNKIRHKSKRSVGVNVRERDFQENKVMGWSEEKQT